MTLAADRIEFGINLFTAELFFAVVTAQLLRTVQRLAS